MRRWLSYLFQPANLLYHAGEHYEGNWFPAYGLLPRWHHASNHACSRRGWRQSPLPTTAITSNIG